MTQPTPSLAEFLLQRIAEDEWSADQAAVPVWRYQLWNGTDRLIDVDDPDDPVVAEFNALDMDAMHAGRWYPARVLAECTAKRSIVEWHTGRDGCCEERLGPLVVDPDPTVSVSTDAWGDLVARWSIGHQQRIGCITLLLLAAPYADHPDYRQEWKP